MSHYAPHSFDVSLYLVVCVSPSFSFFFCSLSLYLSISLFLSFSLIIFSLVFSLCLFLFLSFSFSLSLPPPLYLSIIAHDSSEYRYRKCWDPPPLPTQIPFFLALSPHKGVVFVLGPRECSHCAFVVLWGEILIMFGFLVPIGKMLIFIVRCLLFVSHWESVSNFVLWVAKGGKLFVFSSSYRQNVNNFHCLIPTGEMLKTLFIWAPHRRDINMFFDSHWGDVHNVNNVKRYFQKMCLKRW